MRSIFCKRQFIHPYNSCDMFLLCFLGICADIAQSKHEHWSSLAPLPFELVISAGQKAKEESWNKSTSWYSKNSFELYMSENFHNDV